MWKTLCECGNNTEVTTHALIKNIIKSCGCFNRKDLKGQRFGKLIALESKNPNKHGSIEWECLCDCGNKKIISCGYLLNNKTTHCGCTKPIPINLEGLKYGKITITNKSSKVGKNRTNLLGLSM